MTSLRKVVVATDFSPGSESAVTRAAQVAQSQGAALCLLHAFDVTAWHALKGVFDPQRLTRDPPPDVAATAIGRFVAARQSGLLVMASRAQPSTWGLGSTAFQCGRPGWQ